MIVLSLHRCQRGAPARAAEATFGAAPVLLGPQTLRLLLLRMRPVSASWTKSKYTGPRWRMLCSRERNTVVVSSV